MLRAGAYTDASKPPLGQGDNRLLPVYRYEAPDIVGTGGILREAGSQTEAIALPQRFDVAQGDLTVTLDPSLAATTIDGLDYLRNYPYQCVEQTVSRFLPNIMTYRALDQLGVANDTLKTQLDSGGQLRLAAADGAAEGQRRLGLVRAGQRQPADDRLRPDWPLGGA